MPTRYLGPNYVYAISITPFGQASLLTYDSQIDPPSGYPTLPAGGIVESACLPALTNTTFHVQITGGVDGALCRPAGINTNETVYLVRHAEAHPTPWWEDGNYVGPGTVARARPSLRIAGEDPSHTSSTPSIPRRSRRAAQSAIGDTYSYVRTNTTVLPYAIANNLPYNLAASFSMLAQNPPQLATQASDFFFTGGQFSNQIAARRMGARPHSDDGERVAFELPRRQDRARLAGQRLRHGLDGEARRQRQRERRQLDLRGHQLCGSAEGAAAVLSPKDRRR